MRTLPSRLAGFAIGSLLAVSIHTPVFAQSSSGPIEASYQSIMKSGIIFGNICSDAPPVTGADSCACRSSGQCSLTDLLQVAVNIINFILGISGSVALVMFVYGGFLWVFAQGRSEYIAEGQATLKHAILGLAIIFGAYALIAMTLRMIGGLDPSGASLESTIQSLDVEENGAKQPLNTDEIFQTTQ